MSSALLPSSAISVSDLTGPLTGSNVSISFALAVSFACISSSGDAFFFLFNNLRGLGTPFCATPANVPPSVAPMPPAIPALSKLVSSLPNTLPFFSTSCMPISSTAPKVPSVTAPAATALVVGLVRNFVIPFWAACLPAVDANNLPKPAVNKFIGSLIPAATTSPTALIPAPPSS